MYPALVEKVVAQLRVEHPELVVFEGPSLDGEGLFFIICRPLQVAEFEYFNQVLHRDEEAAKDFVCRMCILDIFLDTRNRFVPQKDLPMGLHEEAYHIVVNNSNFSPEGITELVHEYRSISGQTHMQAIAFICKAFPNLTPDQVERFSARKLAKHISLAEIVFMNSGEEDPYFKIMTEADIVTEEQENAKVLQGIRREASMNDKIGVAGKYSTIDIAAENADQKAMG